MSRKTKTKPFLSKDDIKAIKKACKILTNVSARMTKLEDTRKWCDENKDQDPSGAKWQKATCQLYQLLDEIDAVNIRQLSDAANSVVANVYR